MLNTERVRADLLSPLENLSVGNSLLSTDVAFGHDEEGNTLRDSLCFGWLSRDNAKDEEGNPRPLDPNQRSQS